MVVSTVAPADVNEKEIGGAVGRPAFTVRRSPYSHSIMARQRLEQKEHLTLFLCRQNLIS